MNKSKQHGFTLVELLVVISMIGLLISIGLPALQGVRESSRRLECQVRLARIGEALISYESAYGSLPPGTRNPSGPIHNRPQEIQLSWLVEILPHLGEPAAFAKVRFDRGAYDPVNEQVRQFHIAGIVCPSDPCPPTVAPPSSYAGCHHDVEAPIDVNNHGLLFLNSHVRFDQISDGRGYTLLVGEKQIDTGDLGWMSGTRATLRNTGLPLRCGNTSGFLPAGAPDTYVGGFSSHHTNGVNFVLADGSIRLLSADIDLERLRRLANRSDGNLLEWPTEN